MQEYIGKFFDKVSDPRSSRNQLHDFMMLIGTSLLAMLSGIDRSKFMNEILTNYYMNQL